VWKVRTKIVPVTAGALETIQKGIDQNFQLLPGHLSAIDLQKLTLMHTAHIFLKGLRQIALISCCVLDLHEDRHLISNRRE